MSRAKDTGKMFSEGGEGIEKDLIPKASNNQYSDPFKRKGIFREIWSNKIKRYIAIAITSTFVLTIVIVIIVSKDSKTTNISPNNDSNSKNNTNKRESDSTESYEIESDHTESDSTESDKTESDKTESDSTESDQTESDKTESDEIESDHTESDSTESDKTESDKTESDKIESDSTESDQTESEFIKPDCSEACDNPYDILVYSDEALKSKLKECGYEEVSQSFKFCLSAIKRHNILRACHNAPPLMFNCKIMKISQDYAKYLSENDLFEHSKNQYNGEKLGENLSKYGGDHSGISQGEIPTNMWYGKKFYYNFNYPSYQYNAEPFTQVVWKNSLEFGIGLFCRAKYYNECHIVANYYPTGNYGSEEDYALNVQNLQ